MVLSKHSFFRIYTYFLSCFLMACGGSTDSSIDSTVNSVIEPPDNSILLATFRDTDSDKGEIGGEITLSFSDENPDLSAGNVSFVVA